MRERICFEREIGRLGMFPEQEVLLSDRAQQVDRLLRDEKGFPQWKILALLKCGAVQRIKDGAMTPIAKETEKLKNGEQIDLQSPLNAQCQRSIDAIPEPEYRDYAFANPNPADDYEKFLLTYLGLRPQSKILSSSSVDSLSSFKRAIEKGVLITHPIRHLVIASHASRIGLLALPLTVGAAKILTFEDLQSAVKSKILEIDPKLLDPRPKDASGTIIPPRVHIKGCNIGNKIAEPFLKELKKALGGNIAVTAPKFFHSMKTVFDVKMRGRAVVSKKLVEIWEFFSYEFVIFRTSKLANKADAVAAFLAAAKVDPTIVLINGSTVPQTDWEKWIPAALPAENNVASGDVAVTSSLSTKANSAGTQFRYRKTFFLGKEWHQISLPSDPGTDALRKDEIKKQLVANDDKFRPSHAYPMYARTGFKSIDEYFDSFDWRFKPFDTKKQSLTFSGTRHEYTVLAPIVDPKTNELFMNLFPVSGAPTITLQESDTRFFGSV